MRKIQPRGWTLPFACADAPAALGVSEYVANMNYAYCIMCFKGPKQMSTIRNIYSLQDQGLGAAPEQGSAEWLAGRVGRITGSKPGDLYFNFKQESDWDEILEKWFGDKTEAFDAVARSRMAWGSTHEDTAVNVIVDNIPNAHFFECPMIPIDDVYAASPDGAIMVLNRACTKEEALNRNGLNKEDIAWFANVEIKCPGGGVGKSHEEMAQLIRKKWKTPAPYYMIQIHQEMAAQRVKETLFVAWTPRLTRMWRIPFDADFWNMCLEVLENFRHKNVPFDVMMSKVKLLKRKCFGVSNFPIWKEISSETI